MYAAQARPQIDAEIAKKGRFRMETSQQAPWIEAPGLNRLSIQV